MNWLLKITDGPMRGAEIALAAGSRVTFGKGDGCDIVVADASLAEEAFALDVSSTAVTLVTPDGSTLPMNAFETRTFGTTEMAVGPAEGAWEPLRPAPAETPEPAATEAEPPPASETPSDVAASPSETPEATPTSARSRRPVLVLAAAVVLVALVALLACVWLLRSRSSQSSPQASVVVSETVKLRELAAANGLVFGTTNGVTRLSGNLTHRTERLAVRALALSADRYCNLDLSDDESFRSAAEALLFTVTEGAVKVATATNRALAVTGYAPSQAALVRVREALAKDVPWLRTTRADAVRVGGALPLDLRGNYFAETGRLASRMTTTPAETAAAVVGAIVTNAAAVATNASSSVEQDAIAEETDSEGLEQADPLTPEDLQALALVRAAQATEGKLPRGLLPVAGVLIRPYPCVVLQGGQRLVEGAKVGGLEIRRIEALRVTFGFRKENVYWEP